MFKTHPIAAQLTRWTAELPGSRWFVVGGAVRDALLGRALKDIDIVVTGVETEALTRFLETRGTVDFVGRTFGVFKFSSKEHDARFDIALPRTDIPAGTGGYRDVEARVDPRLPIEDDLARRDFTVNAMAWDASEDRLIDPHGGQNNLEKKMIRAVGDPVTRFQEDYTRMLRGLRFAVQLGFEIDPATWEATRALMPRVNDERDGERLVPFEMVARELLKSLDADPMRTAELWNNAGAVNILMSELGDDWAASIHASLARLDKDDVRHVLEDRPVPSEVRIGLSFAHLEPEVAVKLADRLKLASAGFGVDADLLRRLAMKNDVLLYKALGAQPILSGEAVMRLLNLKPGPDVGRALDLLIDASAKRMISNPSEAEVWLTTHWDS